MHDPMSPQMSPQGAQRPMQPVQPMQPQPMQPGQVPADPSYGYPGPAQPMAAAHPARLEFTVNKGMSAAVMAGCIVGFVAILAYLIYQGYLFNLSDFDDGSRGWVKFLIMLHILLFALPIVVITEIVRMNRRNAHLVVEQGGIAIRSSKVDGGVHRIPWEAIGRVHVGYPLMSKKQRPNTRSAKFWFVTGRDGSILGKLPVTRLTPAPDEALPQVAAIAAGRAQVG